MKVLVRFMLVSMLGLSTIVLMDSCEKVQGCTDIDAENYNADAEESDGNCTYARDKFIGTFSGQLSCQAPLPSDEEFLIVIGEGLTDNSEVLISFQNIDQPLPELTARVTGNDLIIDPETVNIALNPTNPDILTELTYSGEATIDAAGVNLSGELRVLLVSAGATLKCDLTATKQ